MAALTRIVENDEREIDLACELLKAILPASASACQKLQVCVQMNKKKKSITCRTVATQKITCNRFIRIPRKCGASP